MKMVSIRRFGSYIKLVIFFLSSANVSRYVSPQALNFPDLLNTFLWKFVKRIHRINPQTGTPLYLPLPSLDTRTRMTKQGGIPCSQINIYV